MNTVSWALLTVKVLKQALVIFFFLIIPTTLIVVGQYFTKQFLQCYKMINLMR